MITQIMLFDVVFSLDRVITALAMANTLSVMTSAIIVAVVIMLMAMGPLTDFIQRYPTLKMLALCRLVALKRRLI